MDQVKIDYTLSVIGSGQLATSYLTGLLASGFPARRCVRLQRRPASCRFKTTDVDALSGVQCTSELAEVPLDVVMLAVKRKDVAAIAEELQRTGRYPGILLSPVAGMASAALAEAFSPSMGVVRCMPHLGAAVRSSSTLVWPYAGLSASTRQVVDELFGPLGSIWPMDSEPVLDAVTAFAAAGPAYIARMAVALGRGAVKLGLDAGASAAIAKELCVATGKLLESPAASLDTLMAGVASPGGMTERGLDHLQAVGLDGHVLEALYESLGVLANSK